MDAVVALLQEHFGLQADALGPHTIERAVSVRTAALGLHSPVDYLALVRTSPAERQTLLEAVVNRETWFFREPRLFPAIVRLIEPRLGLQRKVCILSVPCSTGEEPYSIAMALLDAGISASAVEVVGLDISLEALEAARKGFYGKVSFRGKDLAFRDRWFTPRGAGWRLSDTVRAMVRVQHGDVLRGLEPAYDVVVCRNLLIYLSPVAVAQLFETLAGALRPDGVLALSATESGLVPPHLFQHSADTLFRRRTKVETPPRQTPPAPAPRPPAPRPPVAAVPVENELDTILDMANQGSYEQAAVRCHEMLKRAGPSAQGYYILGVVDSARGNEAAAREWLRRALYLQPSHEEARLLLSLTGES
ncbi:MAG TPA: CheR family methyltransferase [Candidatus Xenobia bacterium]|jgi:chemotaxis protein methyltransferase WspC